MEKSTRTLVTRAPARTGRLRELRGVLAGDVEVELQLQRNFVCQPALIPLNKLILGGSSKVSVPSNGAATENLARKASEIRASRQVRLARELAAKIALRHRAAVRPRSGLRDLAVLSMWSAGCELQLEVDASRDPATRRQCSDSQRPDDPPRRTALSPRPMGVDACESTRLGSDHVNAPARTSNCQGVLGDDAHLACLIHSNGATITLNQGPLKQPLAPRRLESRGSSHHDGLKNAQWRAYQPVREIREDK
jgi:hypothetical protein